MTRRTLVLGTVVLVCAAALAVLGIQHAPRGAAQSASESSIARWRAVIATDGDVRAYQELSCTLRNSTNELQHPTAHDFGAALYMEDGMSGLSICDDQFGYGCLHEFYGRAIADKGPAVISELDRACRSLGGEKSEMCQHGLGHGIVAYFGYDLSARDTSITRCKSLGTDSGPCESGVFMEYFNRTMLGDNDFAIELNRNDKYAACEGLASRDAPNCIFELPRQWRKKLFVDNATSTEVQQQLGVFCDHYRGDSADYRACYAGIGNDAFILSRRESSVARVACMAASSEKAAVEACLEQVDRLENNLRESMRSAPRCD